MGFYIQGPAKGKADYLVKTYGAVKLDAAPKQLVDGADGAIICVVDNGPFEAAGYAFSQRELEAFSHDDGRPRQWLLMKKATVEQLTGYDKRNDS